MVIIKIKVSYRPKIST